jgi:hypothetical protein
VFRVVHEANSTDKLESEEMKVVRSIQEEVQNLVKLTNTMKKQTEMIKKESDQLNGHKR